MSETFKVRDEALTQRDRDTQKRVSRPRHVSRHPALVDIDLPNNNYKLSWNGNKNKRTEGVGVIVKKCSSIKLIDVEPISSRLLVVKTLIHNLNIEFLVAYVPTKEDSSEVKNSSDGRVVQSFCLLSCRLKFDSESGQTNDFKIGIRSFPA